MSLNLTASCDKCNTELGDTTEIYCEDCYNERVEQEEVLEQLDDLRATLKKELEELQEENMKLRNRIAYIEEKFPLDMALGTINETSD